MSGKNKWTYPASVDTGLGLLGTAADSKFKRPFGFVRQETEYLVPRNSALSLSPMG
jgi:hypothetical protein